MEKQQAYKLLELESNASASDITKAYQLKKSSITEKQASAPTEALKAKFQTMLTAIEQANTLLQSAQAENSNKQAPPAESNSPLSQTKLDDLPGMASSANTNQATLEAGFILAGRYQIKEKIAEGGMGAVYRAFDENRSEDIAIKVMLPALMQSDKAKERFLDEARLSSQLSHPNIVNVFDVQQSDNFFFLTMELLEGQDLRAFLENHQTLRQQVEVSEALEIASKVCAALQYAHTKTVHRDIKPENIFLTEDGQVKLMDFGIARIMSNTQRTQTGAASGTAYYMAPEQLKGRSEVDGRADQYAMGILLYEMLAGEVPTGRMESLKDVRKDKDITKALSNAVDKALSPKPENRFADINAFSEAINSKKSSASMASLPIKGMGIAAALLIGVLGIGALASNGGLDSIWQALKPIDKALIAQQKAEVAKLQGEIKNYQKRLDKGQRNLSSDVRDAERNNANNSSELKYLAHWQRLTDDYLFDGDELTELEGELSKGENLFRQGQQENSQERIKQATTTLTQVRDGYKQLWAQFNGAENLLKAEEQSEVAYQKWHKRKKAYNLTNPSQATEAAQSEDKAKASQREGDFTTATNHWQQAKAQWEAVYQTVSSKVVQIDNRRASDKADREKAAREKAAREKAAREKWLKQATPNMVSIASGSFQMGSNKTVNGEPIHGVSISAFKLSQTEVTFAQWDACVSTGGCSYKPNDAGWGRGNRPVINVSYHDITQQYIPWLNKVTGKVFRLPSEAEWEYAARAGSITQYPWGNSASHQYANYGTDKHFDGYANGRDKWINTSPVKSFQANDFGLYDMHGNVREWTQDCDNNSYHGAPSNGSAWTSGNCSSRVMRGGSWGDPPFYMRSATRSGNSASWRSSHYGFRLAQD